MISLNVHVSLALAIKLKRIIRVGPAHVYNKLGFGKLRHPYLTGVIVAVETLIVLSYIWFIICEHLLALGQENVEHIEADEDGGEAANNRLLLYIPLEVPVHDWWGTDFVFGFDEVNDRLANNHITIFNY